MVRAFGDNGKPDDTYLHEVLSPYDGDHSALSDASKLRSSSFACRKAVLIYGFDYDKRPLEDFAELGMVEGRENRWPHYRLVESPVWDALESLAKAVRAIEAGKAAPRLDRTAKSRAG